MTQCFKEHECDQQSLGQSIRPVGDCESRVQRLYDVPTKVTDVPVLPCEGLWRVYQKEAEDIVAPGGQLIANPIERNRAINAAYARLWLEDQRFEWAGLAAFASKQVGCGLLHAAQSIEAIEAESAAWEKLRESRSENGLFTSDKMQEQEQLLNEARQADARNPLPLLDKSFNPEQPSLTQERFMYVYEMMALGNTTLFLDIYPLHAFFAKRGFKELETCLRKRRGIYGHPRFPVLWLVDQQTLKFGSGTDNVLAGFKAIDEEDIRASVESLAVHEQINILQPVIYEDAKLSALLRGNHAYYVTNIHFLPKIAQPIELTLAGQCQAVEDERTVSFSESPLANLADIQQRMSFVLRAAQQFHQLLNSDKRKVIEASILDIANGNGVR
ncbi:hypothetical protein J3P77_19440 [Pseudomonas sp. R1-18]|uniref:DUF2515 family protein n=1 Tax=Pseudomonas sp. R1-18 TaxID=1632772 RepID=UPI003DA92C30